MALSIPHMLLFMRVIMIMTRVEQTVARVGGVDIDGEMTSGGIPVTGEER